MSQMIWNNTNKNGRSREALYPSKHAILKQYCCDVGPASTTLAQHQNSIGSMILVCWFMLVCGALLKQWISHATARKIHHFGIHHFGFILKFKVLLSLIGSNHFEGLF